MARLKIGVVGYCPPTMFDKDEAKRLLVDVFDQIVQDLDVKACYVEVMVVSGLADVGIPALAYREAVLRNWTTGGVACEKVCNFDEFPVDYRRVVGKNWGEESEAFLAECDVLVRIGGGKQSKEEVKAFSALGGAVYEHEFAAQLAVHPPCFLHPRRR